MTSLLTLVILVLIAFLGSLVFKKYKLYNPIANSLAYTGGFYFLLGFLFGPYVFDIVNQKIINELSVLYALVLGWAGFLIGLQANVKRMKRFPSRYYFYSLGNFLLVLLISFLIFFLYSFYFLNEVKHTNLLILSIAGAVTSPIMFGIIARDYKVIPEIFHLLQFNSAFDNLLGVLAFGAVVAAGSVVSGLSIGSFGLLFSVAISLIAVAIYFFLSKELKTPEERFLLILGLLFIVNGVALHFNQSLIFTSFIFGFGLANSPVKTRGLLQDIAKVEKPMYILLLVFVGVNLNYDSSLYLIIFLLFFIVHLCSKLLSGYVTQFMVPKKHRLGHFGGLGSIGLGGLPLAMILDFYLTKNTPEAMVYLLAVTVTLIIQDAVSWHYLRKTIVKEKRN